MKTNKLFLVTIQGGHSGSGTDHNVSYVVAENSDEAYRKVRAYLDKKDLCFTSERGLESVKLLAEATDYPECETMLFL